MGRRQHVLALNAVSRTAAMSLGWATIDMQPLIAYFAESEYLRDLHHPSKKVSLAALNVLINIAAARMPDDGAMAAGVPAAAEMAAAAVAAAGRFATGMAGQGMSSV
jgi:hypothetical protein